MSVSFTQKIFNSLMERGVLKQEDLEKARNVAQQSKEEISEVLLKMDLVNREDLLVVTSQSLDYPPARLSRLNIPEEVLSLIPRKTCFTYLVLPVSKIGKMLTVAMVDPMNIFAMDDLRAITHMDISPVLADEEEMRESLQKYFEKTAHEEINEIVEDIDSTRMEMIENAEDYSSGDLMKITEEAPVVKLANLILSGAIKERASDIMIEPMETNCRVRYRVDGMLKETHTAPKKFHQALISRIKIMSNMDIAERRLPQDGRFKLRVEDRRVDFRVSVMPSSMGEKAALRVLDKEQATIDLDSLGFKHRDRETIVEASMKPHGMILVCGPTGSGKTTTLYSILRKVDSPGKNLVTVEDPVEYELRGINQVSINEDIGLTFEACLRSILRQDPDVIMVGEIRDFPTMDIAIKSSLTGHMVLSTLHTNTAPGSVVRMVNMGVEPFLIASSVELIAAQRLMRKLCPECRESYTPEKEIAEKYDLIKPDGDIPLVYRPRGCKWCQNSGYKGRIGIIECMRITDRIKELLFEGAEETEIEKAAREEGMITLRENGIENVLEGLTSIEEVLRVTI
jgi:type IV pilus assembly protein PilB